MYYYLWFFLLFFYYSHFFALMKNTNARGDKRSRSYFNANFFSFISPLVESSNLNRLIGLNFTSQSRFFGIFFFFHSYPGLIAIQLEIEIEEKIEEKM